MSKFSLLRTQTYLHPIGPDNHTVVVPMVLEVRMLKGAAELEAHPYWQGAALTKLGRELPRKRRLKAMEIRQPGSDAVDALQVTFSGTGGGETKERAVYTKPRLNIWEESMTFFLGPAGLITIGRLGAFEQQTEGYVDTLVSPEEYGPSRKKKPLTREELQGYLDRAAAFGPG